MKLIAKIFLEGKIKALTGLHIGGSKTDVAIGDIENCVIKTSEGIPYIPGSSLKGKLRSLLEKSEGKYNYKDEDNGNEKENDQNNDIKTDKTKNIDNGVCTCGEKDCKICVIFGSMANKRLIETGPTRLIVRDCHMTEETRRKMENREGEFRNLDLTYTESKWENVIDRITSKAEHPRQTERVPQGAEFEFQMIFNIMEEQDVDRFEYLLLGLNLLEDDYLGGNGSRGYGRIAFEDIKIGIKTIADYEGSNEMHILYTGSLRDFCQKKKDSFIKEIQQKLGAE